MLKEELIQRSPVRLLEKTIHGGLGHGNLGVVTARKGVGKTACLAHLALDQMMRGLNVLHISFSDDPQHVENWYRQLFDDLAGQYKLKNSFDVFDEIKHHRLIIHFKNEVTFDHIRQMINEIEGGSHFQPDTIIVDGRNSQKIKMRQSGLPRCCIVTIFNWIMKAYRLRSINSRNSSL
jgi:KaiC/GvpD/RAD55 family RecA-like ATPase